MEHTGAESNEPLGVPGRDSEVRPGDLPTAWDGDWPANPFNTRIPRSRAMLWLPISLVLVALLCIGGAGYSYVQLLDVLKSPAGAPGTEFAGASRSPVVPKTSAPTSPAGPAPSDYPVRLTEDLGRVCDGWYYPQSPRFSGAAPHPIVVSVRTRKGFDHRFHPASVNVPYELKKSLQDAWQPEDPSKAQLVACVDLVEAGQPIGECKFDKPSSTTVPMVKGIYQLTLYEVATGREITQARVTGAGKCPLVALLTGDRTIYSEVTDRQLYERLHQYVER